MLTGVGLIMFMWSHMVLVASVILGAGVMNSLARFLEDTYMAQVGGPIVGCMFLLHFILAARKVPFRVEQQTAIWKLSRQLRHTDTYLWLVQASTAMIILIMGSIHMWTVLTDLPITAVKSAARVQGGFWLVFYLILLPMVESGVLSDERIGKVSRGSKTSLQGFLSALGLSLSFDSLHYLYEEECRWKPYLPICCA
jgi:fumarate reductase subunit C